MSDIIIKSEEKKEPEKVTEADVKDTLRAADEYEKLKEQNDKLEAEYKRQMELKAKIALGGKADAGTPEESQEDKDKKEAAKLLSAFQ